MVFVNSMSDLFIEALSEEDAYQILDAMLAVPQHQYKVLTKRPERGVSILGRWLSSRDLRRASRKWGGSRRRARWRHDERLPSVAALKAINDGQVWLPLEPLIRDLGRANLAL